MPEPDLTLKDWMDARGISSETVAASLKVGVQTVKNWRSIGVPERRKAHVNYFMSTWKDRGTDVGEIRQNLVLRPTPEQFDRWNDAALAEGKRIADWALQGLDELASEMETQMDRRFTAPAQQHRLRSVLNDEPAQLKAKEG